MIYGSWARDVIGGVVNHGEGLGDPGQWNWEPGVVVGVGLLVGAYLFGVSRLRRTSYPVVAMPAQVVAFLAGSLILLLSLTSPIDVLGEEYLFSVHMVQHILIAGVVPPLLLLGVPDRLIRPLVEPEAVLRIARVLTFPVSAFLVFNLNFWLWHLPVLYELALADQRVHILQHLTFLATGLLNWWPVLSPLRELPPIGYPQRLFYLFVNCQPNVVLGAIFVFSHDVYYRSYATAPRLFDISPLADLQLGGLIMWIPGNAIFLIALSVLFLRWFQESDRFYPSTG